MPVAKQIHFTAVPRIVHMRGEQVSGGAVETRRGAGADDHGAGSETDGDHALVESRHRERGAYRIGGAGAHGDPCAQAEQGRAATVQGARQGIGALNRRQQARGSMPELREILAESALLQIVDAVAGGGGGFGQPQAGELGQQIVLGGKIVRTSAMRSAK